VPGTICENLTRPIRAVPVSRCEPSTDRDTNENVVATKNTTAASPLGTGNRGAEWSGGETLLAGHLTVLDRLVGVGASGDCVVALGTIDVGGFAMFASHPVAVETACMTASRTVKRRLWSRRTSERWGRGHCTSIYHLQGDNPAVSRIRGIWILMPSTCGDSAWLEQSQAGLNSTTDYSAGRLTLVKFRLGDGGVGHSEVRLQCISRWSVRGSKYSVWHP
jgi:hypothetical protein